MATDQRAWPADQTRVALPGDQTNDPLFLDGCVRDA